MNLLTHEETGQRPPGASTLESSPRAKKAMIDKLTEPIGDSPATDSRSHAVTKFAFASGSQPVDGYTIKRGVGRGGFGEVYYATSDAGKEVALKFIRRNLDIELRGAKQCLNLKHPNLVGLYDIKQDTDGDSWLVMEYVADESLADVLERHPQGMPIKDVLSWFHGVAAGVAYLHDHGIVHRDLKPGNIFSDQSIVKVGDYGLSKFISVSRRSGQTESVGTVHYMAPEVGNGRYGKEIDVYALGIILYEMLTGSVPFEGESVGEILMKHLTADPDLAKVSEPYRTVIARALTKDPDERFKNVGEMIALLPDAERNTYTPQSATDRIKLDREDVVEDIVLERAEPSASAKSAGQGPSDFHQAAATDQAAAQYDEPVMQLLMDSWRQVRNYWNSQESSLSPLAKLAILVAATFVLLATSSVWIPALFVLTLVYCAYRVVRFLVLSVTGSSQSKKVLPETKTSAGKPKKKRHRRRSWHEARLTREPPKTTRQKSTELVGSLLLSGLVTAGLSVLMMIYLGRMELDHINQYAWLVVTSAIGAWAVLVPSKIWEGNSGEPALRRFTMMVLGFGLGAIGFLLAGGLMIDLAADAPQWAGSGAAPSDQALAVGNFYSESGEPKLGAYLAYFGVMFLILRWWLQADPFRPARLSLVTTVWIIMVGWAVNLVAPFPQPWGLMIVANMAVAVQLASAWVDPRKPCVAMREEPS